MIKTKKERWTLFFYLFSKTNKHSASDSTTKTLLELVNSTTRIHYFLLTCIERMTSRTHIKTYILTQSGTSFEHITTTTSCFNFLIFRMNSFFHTTPLRNHAATESQQTGLYTVNYQHRIRKNQNYYKACFKQNKNIAPANFKTAHIIKLSIISKYRFTKKGNRLLFF